MLDKIQEFHDFHLAGDTFIMANAWNPKNAVLHEDAGFRAIGTTTAGVARINIGASLVSATFGLVRAASKEMLEHGPLECARQRIAANELCALFSAGEKVQ